MFFARSTLTFSLLLLLGGVVLGFGELRITTTQEFVEFSNNVSKGIGYSGTTVYLDSDIDFTSSLLKQFGSIGNSSSSFFGGTFNGQGHVIKNLVTSQSSHFAGLFFYSKGMKVKNFVVDKTCAFRSNYNDAYMGSTVGMCVSCVIENVVNMASTTYSGINGLYIGGIVGRLVNSNTVRNCVNYGSVTYSSDIKAITCIGGIVGNCEGESANVIQNCANYGAITFSGTISSVGLIMGGIVGRSYSGVVVIENCVSAGKIPNPSQGSNYIYAGGIVGDVNWYVNITHSLWTSDVGYNDPYGHNETTVVVNNSHSVPKLNIGTANELSEYAQKNFFLSKWLALDLNGGKINSLGQEIIVVTQKHFPDPVKGGYTFLYWFSLDTNEIYDPNTTDITRITLLYARWNVFVVTFDGNGGTPSQQSKSVVSTKTYGTLPDPTRTGYTFAGWFTGASGGEKVTEESIVGIESDHTLYAQWTINNYTITFIFNNGKENEVRTLNFNEVIVYPENPTKPGYIFNGWSPRPETMPAENITVTAKWTESTLESGSSSESGGSSVSKKSPESSSTSVISTEFVVIVFEKKGLNKEEAREIIKKYAEEGEFTIMEIESDDETGGTRVIIKFADKGYARVFVDIIRASSDTKLITRVGFVSESPFSLSSFISPFLLFHFYLN